jgi:hypothetical protein
VRGRKRDHRRWEQEENGEKNKKGKRNEGDGEVVAVDRGRKLRKESRKK